MSILFSYRDVDVYERDVELFKDRNWLNDSCISYSFKQIEDSFNNNCIILMDPSVVSFLRIQADEEDIDELAVSLNVVNKNWIFVPVNDNDSFSGCSSHWSLLICEIASGRMYHCDSCRPNNMDAAVKTAKSVSKLISMYDYDHHFIYFVA
jgi:Ulp1 family protease